jgi:hypothetical protein
MPIASEFTVPDSALPHTKAKKCSNSIFLVSVSMLE